MKNGMNGLRDILTLKKNNLRAAGKLLFLAASFILEIPLEF